MARTCRREKGGEICHETDAEGNVVWTIISGATGKELPGYTSEKEALEDLTGDADGGGANNRQDAIRRIREMAKGHHGLSNRAAEILTDNLRGLADEDLAGPTEEELLEGTGGINIDREIADAFAQAKEEQAVLDAQEDIDVFTKEHDEVFRRPLEEMLAAATNSREKAVIQTALDLLKEDFLDFLDEYDAFLSTATLGEDLTKEILRVKPLDFFRGRVPDIMKRILPDFDDEDTVELQNTIARRYIARAEEVGRESAARAAFHGRLQVFKDALDRERNEAGQAHRTELSEVLNRVEKRQDDIEDQWILGGAMDMETVVNEFFTQELRAGTVGTPIFFQVTEGDAVGSLDAVANARGLSGAEAAQAADAKRQASEEGARAAGEINREHSESLLGGRGPAPGEEVPAGIGGPLQGFTGPGFVEGSSTLQGLIAPGSRFMRNFQGDPRDPAVIQQAIDELARMGITDATPPEQAAVLLRANEQERDALRLQGQVLISQQVQQFPDPVKRARFGQLQTLLQGPAGAGPRADMTPEERAALETQFSQLQGEAQQIGGQEPLPQDLQMALPNGTPDVGRQRQRPRTGGREVRRGVPAGQR